MLVQHRAIVTVPGEIGQERSLHSRPKRITEIADPRLSLLLREAAGQFVAVKGKEGATYYSPDDIHVYGPYPSRERLQMMLAAEEMAATSAARSALVLETAEDKSAWSHYLLVANFRVRDPEVKTTIGPAITVARN